MTIIKGKGTGNIHPDTNIDCEYAISSNCLEGSIANDRRFDQVYDNDKKATVFICHACSILLWSQGELVAICNNIALNPTIKTRYEFPKNKNSTSQRKF